MSAEPGTMGAPSVEERLDRLYAELADLKRQVILGRTEPTNPKQPSTVSSWQDLLAAVEAVSAQWEGPGAAGEIRTQRGA